MEEGEPVIVMEDGCVLGRSSKVFARDCIHLEDGVVSLLDVLVMDHSHAFAYVCWLVGDQGISSRSYWRA